MDQEKTVHFSVIKQKIIKTDEVLRMYVDVNNKLKKSQQTCKEIKLQYDQMVSKASRISLEHERCTFNIENLKQRNITLDKENRELREQNSLLEEKYNQQTVQSQLNIRELEEELQILQGIVSAAESCSLKKKLSPSKTLEKKLENGLNSSSLHISEESPSRKGNRCNRQQENHRFSSSNETSYETIIEGVATFNSDNIKDGIINKESLTKEDKIKITTNIGTQTHKFKPERRTIRTQTAETMKTFQLRDNIQSENEQLKQRILECEAEIFKLQRNQKTQKSCSTQTEEEVEENFVEGIFKEMLVPRMLSPMSPGRNENLNLLDEPPQSMNVKSVSLPEIGVVPLTSTKKNNNSLSLISIETKNITLPEIVIIPPTPLEKSIEADFTINKDETVHDKHTNLENSSEIDKACSDSSRSTRRYKYRSPVVSSDFVSFVKFRKKCLRKLSKKRHILNKEIRKIRKLRKQDNLLKILHTLKQLNINFTISNDSSKKDNLDHPERCHSEKKVPPVTQKPETYVSESLNCTCKKCKQSCMLLNKVRDETHLLGFYSIKNEVQTPANSRMENNWDSKSFDLFKQINNSSSNFSNTPECVLETLAEMVSKKLNERGNSILKTKGVMSDKYGTFDSETETEIEKLFDTTDVDVLQRNKMLLETAKKEYEQSTRSKLQVAYQQPDFALSSAQFNNFGEHVKPSDVMNGSEYSLPPDDYLLTDDDGGAEISDFELPSCPPILSPIKSVKDFKTNKGELCQIADVPYSCTHDSNSQQSQNFVELNATCNEVQTEVIDDRISIKGENTDSDKQKEITQNFTIDIINVSYNENANIPSEEKINNSNTEQAHQDQCENSLLLLSDNIQSHSLSVNIVNNPENSMSLRGSNIYNQKEDLVEDVPDSLESSISDNLNAQVQSPVFIPLEETDVKDITISEEENQRMVTFSSNTAATKVETQKSLRRSARISQKNYPKGNVSDAVKSEAEKPLCINTDSHLSPHDNLLEEPSSEESSREICQSRMNLVVQTENPNIQAYENKGVMVTRGKHMTKLKSNVSEQVLKKTNENKPTVTNNTPAEKDVNNKIHVQNILIPANSNCTETEIEELSNKSEFDVLQRNEMLLETSKKEREKSTHSQVQEKCKQPDFGLSNGHITNFDECLALSHITNGLEKSLPSDDSLIIGNIVCKYDHESSQNFKTDERTHQNNSSYEIADIFYRHARDSNFQQRQNFVESDETCKSLNREDNRILIKGENTDNDKQIKDCCNENATNMASECSSNKSLISKEQKIDNINTEEEAQQNQCENTLSFFDHIIQSDPLSMNTTSNLESSMPIRDSDMYNQKEEYLAEDVPNGPDSPISDNLNQDVKSPILIPLEKLDVKNETINQGMDTFSSNTTVAKVKAVHQSIRRSPRISQKNHPKSRVIDVMKSQPEKSLQGNKDSDLPSYDNLRKNPLLEESSRDICQINKNLFVETQNPNNRAYESEGVTVTTRNTRKSMTKLKSKVLRQVRMKRQMLGTNTSGLRYSLPSNDTLCVAHDVCKNVIESSGSELTSEANVKKLSNTLLLSDNITQSHPLSMNTTSNPECSMSTAASNIYNPNEKDSRLAVPNGPESPIPDNLNIKIESPVPIPLENLEVCEENQETDRFTSNVTLKKANAQRLTKRSPRISHNSFPIDDVTDVAESQTGKALLEDSLKEDCRNDTNLVVQTGSPNIQATESKNVAVATRNTRNSMTKLKSNVLRQVRAKRQMLRTGSECTILNINNGKPTVTSNTLDGNDVKNVNNKIHIVQNILIPANSNHAVDLLKENFDSVIENCDIRLNSEQNSSQRNTIMDSNCSNKKKIDTNTCKIPVKKKRVERTKEDLLSKIMKEMDKDKPAVSLKRKKPVVSSKEAIPDSTDEKQWRRGVLVIAENIHKVSPKPVELGEDTTKKNKIFNPNGQLTARQKILHKKLQQLSNEEELPDEIVLEFKRTDVDSIAEIILQQVSQDIWDKPDVKYYPAPLMTKTQRILLGLMVRLERENVENIMDTFLSKTEAFLFKIGCGVRMLNPIVRLYMAVCKLRGDIDKMRNFCCDAFLSLGNLAVPLFFTVLTSWTEVLPMETDVKNYSLAKALIQVVHLKNCNSQGYNLFPLKLLFSQFYGYPKERWNCDELFEELYQQYLRNPDKCSNLAIQLLCKNKDTKWVYTKVNQFFKPLVYKIPSENVNFKATSIILIGNICKRFKPTKKLDESYLSDLRRWLVGLTEGENVHDLITRSVDLSLSMLYKKKKKGKNTKTTKKIVINKFRNQTKKRKNTAAVK